MSDFLVKILQERGISRYRLSKMTGIPQSTIAEWVKNNKTPSADRLAIVADALDVSLDCLIGKTEKSATPSDGFSDDEKKLIKQLASYWGIYNSNLHKLAHCSLCIFLLDFMPILAYNKHRK